MPLLHEVEAIIRPGAEPTRFPFLEPWQVPGKLEQTLKDGGFGDVVESDVLAHAWWYDEKEAAKRVSETLKLMLGDGWTIEEKEKLEVGFLNVLSGGSKHVVHGEGGKVGFEMVAWTGVGRK